MARATCEQEGFDSGRLRSVGFDPSARRRRRDPKPRVLACVGVRRTCQRGRFEGWTPWHLASLLRRAQDDPWRVVLPRRRSSATPRGFEGAFFAVLDEA